MMTKRFPERLPTWAYWLAKERWPALTRNSHIVLTETPTYRVPLVDDSQWLPMSPTIAQFRQEDIELDRVDGLEPITAMGYGPESDTLVIRITPETEARCSHSTR